MISVCVHVEYRREDNHFPMKTRTEDTSVVHFYIGAVVLKIQVCDILSNLADLGLQDGCTFPFGAFLPTP